MVCKFTWFHFPNFGRHFQNAFTTIKRSTRASGARPPRPTRNRRRPVTIVFTTRRQAPIATYQDPPSQETSPSSSSPRPYHHRGILPSRSTPPSVSESTDDPPPNSRVHFGPRTISHFPTGLCTPTWVPPSLHSLKIPSTISSRGNK
jgi:hypothetical protein